MSFSEDASEERKLLVSEVSGKATVVNVKGNDVKSSTSLDRSWSLGEVEINDARNEEEEKRSLNLEQLLAESLEADLSTIEESQCFYRAGVDKQGRPIIVFIGKWFSKSRFDLHKALLYLIKLMDRVANNDYVVVYFHTKTSSDSIPSYFWIKQVYNTLTYKYKKHLKAFYIVHPTLWTKVTCWWFTQFMAPAIKTKIRNIHALEELSNEMKIRDLSIPIFITEWDMSLHGVRPFKP